MSDARSADLWRLCASRGSIVCVVLCYLDSLWCQLFGIPASHQHYTTYWSLQRQSSCIAGKGGKTDIYGLYLSTLLHYLVITNMWYFKSEENIVHFPLMLSSDAQKTLQTHKHVTSTEMVIQIYPYSSIPNNIVRNFEASGLDTASLTSVMWVVWKRLSIFELNLELAFFLY